MTSSPYAQVGPKLVDSGFSAIPCRPGSKVPGAYRSGEWFYESEWQRFCDRLPTELELGVWAKWPDAGICVALGGEHGLVALDIDTTDHEVIAAVESVVPPSPVQKIGSKGYCAFYRGAGVKDTKFPINGKNAVEVLTHGRQVVVPPTIHPDTKQPYVWVGDALDRHTPEGLPELPADVIERLADALAPFGYAALERDPVERTASGGSTGREINDAALAHLDCWVGALGIDAKRQTNGNWRGVAVWRGGENRNVGFDPKGIKDFKTDEKHTAIDVTMKALDMPFGEAADWLKARLGFEEPPRAEFTFRKPGAVAESDEDVPLIDPLDVMRMIIGAREEALALADPNDAEDAAWIARMRQEIVAFSEGILSARERFPADTFGCHFITAAVGALEKIDVARDLGAPVEAAHVAAWLEKAINALIEQPEAEQPEVEQPERAEAGGGRFKFTAIGDIPDDDEAVEWAVRGLLAKNTVSLFFGKPSGGKGVVASSLAVCLAAGLPFLGMEVAQAPTVYFAAERLKQVRRRIKGLMRKHGLPNDTPCFIGGGPLDIRKESDAKELIREVRAIEERTGTPVGFIVVDTFSRALAGGKENDTADMGAAVKNVELIRSETGAHVLIVHHVGLAEDAQTRPRGNSALTAAADICVLITKTKSGVDLTVTVERDGLEGKKIKAKFASFKTGVDDRGKDLTVPYLDLVKVHEPEDSLGATEGEEEGDADAAPKVDVKFEKPGTTDAMGIKALGLALRDHGYVPLGHENGFPDDVATVSWSQWRAEYDKLRPGHDEANRKAFSRVGKKLVKSGRVITLHDRVWLP